MRLFQRSQLKMKLAEISFEVKLSRLFRAALMPVPVTLFLWFTTRNEVSAGKCLLSGLLLLIPWHSYLRWRQSGRDDLPLFSMLAFVYWIYYAMPLFWGDLAIHIAHSAFGREAPAEQLTAALLMAVVGVGSLWLGMRTRIGQRLVPRVVPELSLDGSRLNYLRLVLICGGLLSLLEPSPYLLGEGGRQMIILSLGFIPLLAFAILFRAYLRNESSGFDKILVLGFLITRFVVGLASGWLGSAASIMIICAATYIAERGRIPRLAVATVILFTLFFQVGKEEFRSVYWTEEIKATQVDRVSFWVNTSLTKWSEALSDSSGGSLNGLVNQSVSRVSLLTASADVLDQTPRLVPYQYGALYSYLFVTFIPRFVWPDKPSVNEANRFYQVAYGVTAEEDLGNVAIAVGVLTEGYISFGWYGVLGVMFLLGIFFGFYQRTFLGKSSGLLMSSLGIALLPQMLGIESQMATYLGGIIQQVAFSLVILLPVIRWRKMSQSLKLSPLVT